MKNIIFALFAVFFIANSCTSQTYIENGLLNKIIEQEEFTFMAEKANIDNADVLNIMNSLPGSATNRIQNLDYGSGIVFHNKEMKVNLPFFGRTYNARNRENGGFVFTSKEYTIEKKAGKKGQQILTISPKDAEYVNKIYLEINTNGKTYVSISSNDRQPMSFIGYIMKNEDLKEEATSK
ncbi:DUF4251 domain-containing protein [Frigoriflavimonas asaccharolytica]|uniref:DUF4251 domain-containing protein n=1 Tax=Frigoriflavimonas asaccharolytica TaxID=2735899 RepID=A0A8J8GAX0_9FLAO|nr:DUF4251 domain-containing protein [Frigoriflavimonas asaccharolytica]NRS92287.1 hypothetical protein [Frigoriflavimonas asaccharolytica]